MATTQTNDGMNSNTSISQELIEMKEIIKACKKRKEYTSQERLEKIENVLKKGDALVGTEYHLGGTLGITEREKGIDCSHFVAYCLDLPEWKRENTWSLDEKYRENEVDIQNTEPGDLLMRPWHYDPDVKREIGHVELIIGKTGNGDFVTLGASGISNIINKYTLDGVKLPKHNCVGYTIRKLKEGMRILRA